MNIDNPNVSNTTVTSFILKPVTGTVNAARGYFGSLFFPVAVPVEANAIPGGAVSLNPTNPNLGAQARRMQQEVGPKLSQLAKKTGDKYKNSLGGFLPTIVNPEQLLLHVFNNTQDVLEKTSLQQLGESFHVITDFLTRYRQAFAELSSRTFESAEEEELAWKEKMGEYWHPMISSDVYKDGLRRAEFGKFLEKRILQIVDKILLKDRILFASFPGLQSVLTSIAKKFTSIKLDEAVANPQTDSMFQAVAKVAVVLAERDSLYAAVYSKAAELHEKTITDVNPLEDNKILVETIGGKQRVFYCTPRAAALGIRIGMEGTVAKELWDGKKEPAELAAQIVTEDDDKESAAFGGRKTLKEMIRTPLEAFLSQASPKIRQRALNKVGSIPKIGLIAKPVLRVLFWMTSLSLKGVNFFVGIPSSKVLAEEIADNLMKHIENPAIIAAPFLLIDRLVDIIEGKTAHAYNAGDSDREAFIGELIIEVGKTMATLCPSLFKWRFPKVVSKVGNAALWVLRKGVALTGLAIANPVTRKIASIALKRFYNTAEGAPKVVLAEKVLYWIQSSSLTLFRSKDALRTTHTILKSGYKILGDMGVAPTDQSHFQRAGQSLAHLIHHTILGFMRMSLQPGVTEGLELVQGKCNDLLAKRTRAEELSDEDYQFLKDHIVIKSIPSDFDAINQKCNALKYMLIAGAELTPEDRTFLKGRYRIEAGSEDENVVLPTCRSLLTRVNNGERLSVEEIKYLEKHIKVGLIAEDYAQNQQKCEAFKAKILANEVLSNDEILFLYEHLEIVAVTRSFVDVKLKCDVLKQKIARGQQLSEKETQFLQDHIRTKLAACNQQKDQLPIIELQTYVHQFLDHPDQMNQKIDKLIQDLQKVKDEFAVRIAQTNAAVDEASPAYIYYQEQVGAIINALTNLKQSPDIRELSEYHRGVYIRELAILLNKQNQLVSSFNAFSDEIIRVAREKSNSYDQELLQPTDPVVVAKWISEYLTDAGIEVFAEDRVRKEGVLAAQLEQYSQEYAQMMTLQNEVVGRHQNSVDLQNDLEVAKSDYMKRHQATLEKLSQKSSGWLSTLKSLRKPIVWLQSWQADYSSTKSQLFDEIDFYRPGRTKVVRESMPLLLAKIHLTSTDLIQLSSKERMKSLVRDPVWLLGTSGKDLVTTGKRILF